jgi:hypothetical protein
MTLVQERSTDMTLVQERSTDMTLVQERSTDMTLVQERSTDMTLVQERSTDMTLVQERSTDGAMGSRCSSHQSPTKGTDMEHGLYGECTATHFGDHNRICTARQLLPMAALIDSRSTRKVTLSTDTKLKQSHRHCRQLPAAMHSSRQEYF